MNESTKQGRIDCASRANRRRVEFNMMPSTAGLRKCLAEVAKRLPLLPAEHRERAEYFERRLDSVAPAYPRRVMRIPGNTVAIRFALRGALVLFATWSPFEMPSVAVIARLADAAAYFFRGYRTKALGSYNYSESQAKADSELPLVTAALEGFKTNLNACGITPVTDIETGKAILNPDSEIDTALLTLRNRVEEMWLKLKHQEKEIENLKNQRLVPAPAPTYIGDPLPQTGLGSPATEVPKIWCEGGVSFGDSNK